ncbi:MAG: TolC family protein [Candidatus Cloacimonetes bacterium]|nr:TolC family protein [Candidatus Cloacimonadota bacterium]
MKKVILTFILMLMFFALPAITLEESIELAKENNKELLAEKSAFKSADWSKKNALTNFLPKASFNSTMIRIDDDTYDLATGMQEIPVLGSTGMPTGDYIPFSTAAMGTGFYKTTYTNDISIQQSIFNGGKVILGYQLAKLAKKQAYLALQSKEKDVSYAIASTYFGILKLQDLQTLSQKSLESTLSHLESVQKNYEVGTAKKSDVLQWQVKQKNDETALSEIGNNIDELYGFWQILLGAEEAEKPSEIDVTEYDSETLQYAVMEKSELEKAAEEFLTEVEKTSPTIQTMELAEKMMEKNYCMAKGEFLPSLNLQFSYQFESDDEFDFDGEDNWNLVAAFSVPIFTSGTNYSNLKKSKYDLKKTKYETEFAQENYMVTAKNVFYKLITKARTVEDNKTALEFAQENHKIVNELYTQGMVTNTELMDAEAMLFGSEMNLVASYYDYILLKYEIKKYTN